MLELPYVVLLINSFWLPGNYAETFLGKGGSHCSDPTLLIKHFLNKVCKL